MVTLDRLVNVLGSYGVRLCTAEVSRAAVLRSVVLHEPAAQLPDGRPVIGDVLLAMGAGTVPEALQWARSSQSIAVLVRDEDATVGPETADDIAVLAVDPAVSWSELAGVVYGLVLEGRETAAGRGPTDLFALADSIADSIGAAVIIEDGQSRLLGYSRLQAHADPARAATILHRQVPEDIRESLRARGVFTHLAHSDEPLFIEADPDHGLTGRTVMAVRAGRELLGSVWVTSPEPLDDTRRRVLSDGARTVAMHVLRSRASADLERHVESDLVTRLLDGSADAATTASRLGLRQTGLRVIAVHASIADQPHAALLLAFEYATSGFGWSRPGRSSLAGNTLYTVLPGEEADAARQWIEWMRVALPAETTIHAGISAPAEIAELASARQEADECLALHESPLTPDSVPAYDESWHDILLHRLRTAARSTRVPARGPVTELRRHDASHSTQYVATLRAWLTAQGDLTRAGELLGVHENTVRYRLRKMAEVTVLDLDDPYKRLAMTIELAAIPDESP
ncbi:PucR family transcriptional regulator [Mycolicibacterium diernhoferi]|uniref:PucR family transcriptional regulator n=3 Tax=Mycolicibacterium diernhoferi TaxID=1801 RepID=A0A1Q4H5P4_9MYCO|nr:PucR family transcriptional regulator [Mycolicibacterium diernhoferi]OJZ62785.1 PucR family transcriptional regulator [Mycolicibacterium diernhoferi]PEG55424.1 PucR family transcriptional regulator [Mycolicibacterium diernhoferi]QYL24342.1 helix-turn-helix domain-containing protein [Mycolicibacterium diernhoferi]